MTHKKCKAIVRRELEKIAYLSYQLRNMKNDMCPATENMSITALDSLDELVRELRREILYVPHK